MNHQVHAQLFIENLKEHIEAENKILKENDFEDIHTIREKHDDVIIEVEELYGKFLNNELGVREIISTLINDILKNHLLEDDAKFFDFFSKS